MPTTGDKANSSNNNNNSPAAATGNSGSGYHPGSFPRVSATVAPPVDVTRELWRPLNDSQIKDMLQELSNLVISCPSCLFEKDKLSPLRELIEDAIHYPRKYIKIDPNRPRPDATSPGQPSRKRRRIVAPVNEVLAARQAAAAASNAAQPQLGAGEQGAGGVDAQGVAGGGTGVDGTGPGVSDGSGAAGGADNQLVATQQAGGEGQEQQQMVEVPLLREVEALKPNLLVTCDRYINAWETKYRELEEYRSEFGDCNVPKTFARNPQLGRWVGRQREQYKLWRDPVSKQKRKTQLTQSRYDRLNALGFTWDAQDALWETRLKELVEFKAEHGHVNVPMKYTRNPTLAIWVSGQRREKKQLEAGKKSFLTPARLKALEDLGMEWGRDNMSWDERFNELQAYKEENGNFDVPIKYPENPGLAAWVDFQRLQYQHFHNPDVKVKVHITQERIAKLDSIGFNWKREKEYISWEDQYVALQKYKEEHGDCNVPKKYPPNEALGKWVDFMRLLYEKWQNGKRKKININQDKIDRLNEIGFSWDREPLKRPPVTTPRIRKKKDQQQQSDDGNGGDSGNEQNSRKQRSARHPRGGTISL